MNQILVAFKYCNKGCGADYYYGFSVEQTIGTLDACVDPALYDLVTFDSIKELLEKTTSYKRIIVVYLFRNVYAKEVFGEVKELQGREDKEYTTIAAGTHPSGAPLEVLKLFDYVIVGDCEVALVSLVNQIIKGRKGFVPGVWSKKDGNVLNGGRTELVDLNSIPPFAEKRELFSPIEITRGCPWGCKFCCVPYVYGGVLRHRSVENIGEAVKIMKSHGKRVVNFLTPNSFAFGSVDGRTANVSAIKHLLQTLSKIGGMKIIFGNYLSNVRPDFVTDELVGLVKKYTQTPSIHMGGQSGSERVLEHAGVGYTVGTILRAVKIVRQNGLGCSVDIMLGLPRETETDRIRTRELLLELTKIGAVPRVHAFMPLPGTPFSDEPQGRVGRKDLHILGKLAHGGKIMQPFVYEECVGQ